MKLIKLLGLIILFSFTFLYTEKIINVSIEQDSLMEEIKEKNQNNIINPTNAIIKEDTIIPGIKGKSINYTKSYKNMKKINYYDESYLIYENLYPEISIYNHYNYYLIKGNQQEKSISLIYIINNEKSLSNITNYNKNITLFIDSNFLSNNINLISKIKDYEIYNYGNNGLYTKENLIIGNNILTNKTNNTNKYCLFLERNKSSKEICSNSKIHSILISNLTTNEIKNNLSNGGIYLINNLMDLNNLLETIKNKGYNLTPLSHLIYE